MAGIFRGAFSLPHYSRPGRQFHEIAPPMLHSYRRRQPSSTPHDFFPGRVGLMSLLQVLGYQIEMQKLLLRDTLGVLDWTANHPSSRGWCDPESAAVEERASASSGDQEPNTSEAGASEILAALFSRPRPPEVVLIHGEDLRSFILVRGEDAWRGPMERGASLQMIRDLYDARGEDERDSLHVYFRSGVPFSSVLELRSELSQMGLPYSRIGLDYCVEKIEPPPPVPVVGW